jgi:hypothetical protein
MSFLDSFKQSKKGMPRAGREALKRKEDETVVKLTGEPKAERRGVSLVLWSDVDQYPDKIELLLQKSTIKEQLVRTVHELFRGKSYTTKDRTKAFFPSTSANYISNRSNAGAVGAILQHPTLLQGLRKAGGYFNTETKSREEEIEGTERIMVTSDQTDFKKNFDMLWIRILQLASKEEANAEPVGLPEALKIRVITKGPPFIQTVLRGLWKFLHTTLKKHPAFTLIGQPIDEVYILDRMGAKLKETEGYLSGDYEGATDNLKSWISETIAEAIGEELKLYPVERRLFITALTQHILRGKKQTTGQLMGSIVSFPILCIANAALTRWAYEVDQKKTCLLRDTPMMINGDDVVLKCSAKGYSLWSQITREAGLIESLGKTYFSREFLNMNSTTYIRDELNPQTLLIEKEQVTRTVFTPTRAVQLLSTVKYTTRTVPFRLVKYINMGLMNGLKRSGLSVGLNDQDDPRNNIGTRYREMIRLCPETLIHKAHKIFINSHRKLLVSSHLPWYIPEWLGGLGITGIETPSVKDLRISRMIIQNWKTTRPISLAHQEMNWKTWQLAAKHVPEPFIVQQKNKGCEDYNNVVAEKCIDLLFDSNVTLEDLFTGIQEGMSKTKVAISHNARMWKVSTYKHLGKPLTMEELKFQGRYLSYQNENLKVNQELLNSLD